jgi:hypothetical protein
MMISKRTTSVRYTNRIGKTYYLREGKTKSGKPRYFFSAQPEGKGDAVDRVPEGFEIYEHPKNAQIFLRKRRPKLITDIEKYLVEKQAMQLKRSKRYCVDCTDEYITIYESDADIGVLKDTFGDLLKGTPLRPGMTADKAMHTLIRAADKNYSAMMRFRLVDKDRREFIAERFCFLGSIDDWVYLGGPDDLKELADRYIKLLGTDKFFDSPYY